MFRSLEDRAIQQDLAKDLRAHQGLLRVHRALHLEVAPQEVEEAMVVVEVIMEALEVLEVQVVLEEVAMATMTEMATTTIGEISTITTREASWIWT